jgi:hypothetical protein
LKGSVDWTVRPNCNILTLEYLIDNLSRNVGKQLTTNLSPCIIPEDRNPQLEEEHKKIIDDVMENIVHCNTCGNKPGR